MNNTLREILGLKTQKEEEYHFKLSNPNLHKSSSSNMNGEYVMLMGQIFALLVPKDRLSAKYRGYQLSDIAADMENGYSLVEQSGQEN